MEQKYKAHFMDMDNYGEVIKRVVLNEDQKKLIDFLFENNICLVLRILTNQPFRLYKLWLITHYQKKAVFLQDRKSVV